MTETVSTGSEGTEGTPPVSTPTTVEQLPEFARNLITNLRQENAKHRTSKTEAVEAAKLEAQTDFETKLSESTNAHEATKGELGQTKLELAKLTAAINAGVPVDKLLTFASRLNGSTEEELKADAEEAKKLYGVTSDSPVDPSAGQGSNGGDPNTDFSSYVMSLFDK